MVEMQNPYGKKLIRGNLCEVAMHNAWRICHKTTLQVVVKWLDEPCPHHSRMKRHGCRWCMEELRKAVEGEL